MVLRTLGASQRRLIGGRRPRRVADATEPEPVPTSRATLVAAAPFDSPEEAATWLERVGGDVDALNAEATAAAADLNTVLRLHRAASADPYPRDVSVDQALVARVGYGSGDEVAEGRFSDAVELPRVAPRRPRGDMIAPQERMAALLNARDVPLACEELVLRARADVEAGRFREAALQTRVALEAALAELSEEDARDLASYRQAVAQAANAALDGEPSPELSKAVEEAVSRIQAALRRRALR